MQWRRRCFWRGIWHTGNDSSELRFGLVEQLSQPCGDEQRAEQRKASAPRKSGNDTPEIQNQAAATSLADNDALAELKAKLAEQSSAE